MEDVVEGELDDVDEEEPLDDKLDELVVRRELELLEGEQPPPPPFAARFAAAAKLA